MAKARKQKLKVFRTPAGFHDAYVAAPSRKAALEAWGAGTDLFSAGISEEVKDLDGEAAREALTRPGEIVRAKRTGADIIPMPKRPAAKAKKEREEEKDSPSTSSGRTAQKQADPGSTSGVTKKTKPKPKPRPSRAALDKAEKALAQMEAKQSAERAELDREEKKLADRRRALEGKQRAALAKAEARRDEAERAYRKAMREWTE